MYECTNVRIPQLLLHKANRKYERAGWDGKNSYTFTLCSKYGEDGMSDEPEDHEKKIIKFPKADDDDEHDCSEDQLAIDFVARYKHILRYDVIRSKEWFAWNGSYWELDRSLFMMSARRFLQEMARDIKKAWIRRDLALTPHSATREEKKRIIKAAIKKSAKIRQRLLSKRTIEAVISLAKHDPAVIVTTDQWDNNNWLLNTPDGTVDLKTGVVRPHDHRDYMQYTCRVSVDYTQEPTQWIEFLHQTFASDNGSQDMVDYIQRVLGYCLTGDTTEHALFYAWGKGQNGKTTVIETVSYILNDYAVESPPQVFVTGNEGRHETDLARLHGARLVSSDELPHGQVWDTSKLKRLTGGGRIAARFMYTNHFQFIPRLKLFIAGNDKPKIKQLDDGIRRRLHFIPFINKVPDHLKDKSLPAKLQEEAPAILAWMIEGCLKWQQRGLDAPELVRKETAKYLNAQDDISTWLDECCMREPGAIAYLADLHVSWSAWCKLEDRKGTTKTWLSSELDENSTLYRVEKGRNSTGVHFKGVRLVDLPAPPIEPLKSHR